MEPTLFAAVFIAMIAAGCVKGVLGLGLPLTSIAILGTVMDLRQAIPIIVVPILVTNAFQATQGGMLAAQFRRFWSLNLTLCAGTWGGTVLLFIIDPAALLITLGAVVVGYALINLFAITIRVPANSERWMSPVVGMISGVLTGATGSVGAPIAIYMQALGLDKVAFLQAVSLSFFITAVVWIAPDRSVRLRPRDHRRLAVRRDPGIRRHVDWPGSASAVVGGQVPTLDIRLPVDRRRQSDPQGDRIAPMDSARSVPYI